MHFCGHDGIDSELFSEINPIVNCGEYYSEIESVVLFCEEEGSIDDRSLIQVLVKIPDPERWEGEAIVN